jgi:hypothetical protein
MKEIPLTKGQVALVDDDDYVYLSQFKWYANKKPIFYAVRRHNKMVNGKEQHIKMHREILKRYLRENFDDSLVVDHINHNGLDNRKENLRLATNKENCNNRRNKKESIYEGVYINKGRRKVYQAQAYLNKKRIYLGSFVDEIEAAIAYIKAAYGPEWLYE